MWTANIDILWIVSFFYCNVLRNPLTNPRTISWRPRLKYVPKLQSLNCAERSNAAEYQYTRTLSVRSYFALYYSSSTSNHSSLEELQRHTAITFVYCNVLILWSKSMLLSSTLPNFSLSWARWPTSISLCDEIPARNPTSWLQPQKRRDIVIKVTFILNQHINITYSQYTGTALRRLAGLFTIPSGYSCKRHLHDAIGRQ